MSIFFDEQKQLFRLVTDHTEYQMKINKIGNLQHCYYGRKVGNVDMSYLHGQVDRGYAGNPYEISNEVSFSLDNIPQEYPTVGTGDFRTHAMRVTAANGSRSCDPRYVEHRISDGKYTIPGLPFVRENEAKCQTLVITLCDRVLGLELSLSYGVFEKHDIITRTVAFVNRSNETIRLEKAASVAMDFTQGQYEYVHFHGRHAMERMMERMPVAYGTAVMESSRGMSSHQHNPFVILCDPAADEDKGSCWGFLMMYSGNHKEEIQREQTGQVRVVMGISDDNFSWKLESGACFHTPETILSYSAEGFGRLSHNYHHIIRENVIPQKYMNVRRPVLINNWEATYFGFNTEKILKLARQAAELGVEMLVLDDGWFGKRDDDTSGLGDWFVNEKKLPGGLKPIVEEVNALGMKFGLWFEPEMINEDSELFRAHPDWALRDPDRLPMISRHQLLLDMSRQDVQDYLFETISEVLESANIEYVKWDFNRSMANAFSNLLPADQQGELPHRFMLGTYALTQRLLDRFPHLMIEGCTGGGGRFDAGMMFYCPQIWCSDDTDPIARLQIQKGSSFAYPISTMGSHVSASPNHQTGRSTSLQTRGVVAMSGTFGYELDLAKLSDEEKELVKKQIQDFHTYYWLIQKGEYFRLTDERTEQYYYAWEFAAEDGSEALLNMVIVAPQANPQLPHIFMKGLKEDAIYELEGSGRCFTGAALMYGGYTIADVVFFPGYVPDTFPSRQLHFMERSNHA